MKFKAVLADGNPWTNGSLIVEIIFNPIYPNKLSSKLVNSYETATAQTTTDSVTGIAEFTNFKFLNQPQGAYFMRIVGINPGYE